MTATGVPKSKATQVADALREELKRMKPGDKLPSQRELVERFGFASQTVQNGLAALRAEGLIVSAGNLGNFVGDGSAPTGDVRDELKEIRSQLQTLTERLEALEARSLPGGA
ncbi:MULTISPECIES: winged helix-turn-helix domain-containing protein [Streptomyces]|jgi:DNA-binding GntR family transcriptional regulator|uniref:Winged helix-turn-helix transcriptional regulator n=1 Tax=Streptomyces coelicoflavus TaxID=285562 RepID=A0A6N9UNF1_9ACTN|nr:winged helix-turn-helix domain-containing protein [Streptomyces coelicoflavus]NEB16622.1 winged helix-turn-helix transcriptional regulator [Streptomyces coelicoflavus]